MRTTTILISLLALSASGAAHAAIYKVGPATDTQCTHTTMASAIAAAASNPGVDTIRIAVTQGYANQALTINSNDDLQIIGGFLGCSRATPEPGVKAVVDGATGSVFRILGNGRVSLRQLEISGGNATGGSEGGGIYYQGNGTLEIHDSGIINNVAGYGGGLFARGTGIAANVQIGANVIVSGNTARYSGGGVYLDQLEMAMREPGSAIAFNTAEGADESGYGGGLMIRGANLSSYAYVGSTGFGTLGAIFGNTGRYGGGVAVVGADTSDGNSSSAVLQLFTTDAAFPGAIRDNVATVAGGGIFVASEDGGVVDGVFATAEIYNAVVSDNRAPRGAAVYIASSGDPLAGYPSYGYVEFNGYAEFPEGALPCVPGHSCGRVSGNVVADGNGNPADGAVFQMEAFAFLDINYFGTLVAPYSSAKGGIEIRGNRGAQLIRSIDDEVEVGLRHALITENVVDEELISLASSYLYLSSSTITDNAIGSPAMIAAANSEIHLLRSILWQPGKTTLSSPPLLPSSVDSDNVLASEIASIGGTPGAFIAAPRFNDPARGDYGLRAASPAVDYAATRTFDDNDLFGNPRIRGLSLVDDFLGPVDLGALERQASLPLVLNPDFDGDANLWTAAGAGAAPWYWTGAQNFGGSAGSGAIYVGSTPGSFESVGAAQCIHLPIAARYVLNGKGRIETATNTVALRWQFRRNGGEACTTGNADRSGELVLANSPGNWTSAAQSAAVDVSPEEWTDTSSITVFLVSAGRQPGGWFDAISVDAAALDDVIFRNGFEP